MPKRIFHPLLLLALLCFFPACASKPLVPGEVLDLRTLPQQPSYYIHAMPGATELIPAQTRERLAGQFLERHFSPWNGAFDPGTDTSDPFWGLKHLQNKELFGENNLPQPTDWLEDMARRSAVDLYPSLVQPAVTVATASLRVLPTHRPAFYNPSTPGQGFPFDSLQNSLVHAGTPILVVHASLDGAWYLVKTPHASGWLRPWEFAWVDQAFMDAYRSAGMAGFVRDDVAVTTNTKMFLFSGRVGMILPRSSEPSSQGTVSVLAPLRRTDGWAELEASPVPDTLAKPWPLVPTKDNFAHILDALMGQAYGWGGLFENRDCSALIQDVYALFGMAMPRNSRAQAQAGQLISLDGLSARQKEERILEQGTPLLTIVNMPGHVMLYLGTDPASGRPVVLHSIWGLRTQPSRTWARQFAAQGRWVIGKTVITTLTPGAELPTLAKPQGLLVKRITGMTILGQ